MNEQPFWDTLSQHTREYHGPKGEKPPTPEHRPIKKILCKMRFPPGEPAFYRIGDEREVGRQQKGVRRKGKGPVIVSMKRSGGSASAHSKFDRGDHAWSRSTSAERREERPWELFESKEKKGVFFFGADPRKKEVTRKEGRTIKE